MKICFYLLYVVVVCRRYFIQYVTNNRLRCVQILCFLNLMFELELFDVELEIELELHLLDEHIYEINEPSSSSRLSSETY